MPKVIGFLLISGMNLVLCNMLNEAYNCTYDQSCIDRYGDLLIKACENNDRKACDTIAKIYYESIDLKNGNYYACKAGMQKACITYTEKHDIIVTQSKQHIDSTQNIETLQQNSKSNTLKKMQFNSQATNTESKNNQASMQNLEDSQNPHTTFIDPRQHTESTQNPFHNNTLKNTDSQRNEESIHNQEFLQISLQNNATSTPKHYCHDEIEKIKGCIAKIYLDEVIQSATNKNKSIGYMKTHYKNGEKEETEKIDINNTLIQEAPYKNEEKEDIQKEYYATQGNLRSQISYKNDKKEGMAYSDFKNGNLPSEEHYIGNTQERIFREYYSSGGIKTEISYKNAKGVAKKYNEDGVLMAEFPFNNGKLDGIVRLYYNSGKIFGIVPYRNDKLNGATKIYYESGKIKSARFLKNDKGIGNWKEYYENGNLWRLTPFINAEINGIAKQYYDNKNLAMEVTYGDGDIKEMKFYSNDNNNKAIGYVSIQNHKVINAKCMNNVATPNLEDVVKIVNKKMNIAYNMVRIIGEKKDLITYNTMWQQVCKATNN